MELEKIRYNDSYRSVWDEHVKHSINGTFLHSKAFLEHNPLNAEQDHSLLFFKKGKLLAVLPAILYERDGKKILHSHGRSTYGGIVATEKVGIDEAVEIVKLVVEEGKENRVGEIIVRNPFRIFYDAISDESDYALWYHGFGLKARELEIYVPINGGIDAMRKRYDNGTKYNIKKAYKFVTVQESSDFEKFWALLEQNLATKHGLKPVHSLAEFYTFYNAVGRDSIRLFGAYYNDQLVGGCIVFMCGKRALHAQYIAQDGAYQEFRPVNAVIDAILEWGAQHGFESFNLGTANEDGGRVINSGLFHFKGGFGGRGVLRETMHLLL